ncbi:hypothetical protein [Pelagibacterium mangrovi]|uniref:hypothetical protein n=1 Tax=Pelagibacterium mangrovi TaxID=3119828 RepID=UPI002FC897B9
MSKTTAQRRRDDRDRKRAERERRRASGIPESAAIQNAVTEALSFAILTLDRRSIQPGNVPINAALVIAVAVDILSKRGGYNEVETRKAVRDALAPREAHRMAGHIPSVSPDGSCRYRTTPPSS